MGQLLQFLIKPDFAKAKPDVILAQGTCGQLGLDLEAEQRKALAMNGDVLAWPEGGVSPDTSSWAGPGHRRPSMCLEMLLLERHQPCFTLSFC